MYTEKNEIEYENEFESYAITILRQILFIFYLVTEKNKLRQIIKRK